VADAASAQEGEVWQRTLSEVYARPADGRTHAPLHGSGRRRRTGDEYPGRLPNSAKSPDSPRLTRWTGKAMNCANKKKSQGIVWLTERLVALGSWPWVVLVFWRIPPPVSVTTI